MTTMQMATDRELLGIETSYWEAIKSRNAEDVARMTAEDCTIVGASGVTGIDPRSIATMVESAPFEIASYAIDLDSVKIVRLDDETATISYRVHEEVDVDRKRVALDAFDSSVWRLHDDGWRCVLHTESIAGDAFGRDRTGARPA
jgi:hypothetical protein